MGQELKILLLEDSKDDVLLIEREIKRSGILATFKVVDKKAEYSEALENFRPDIILCDHSMPSFNSIEALKLYKFHQLKYQTRIPFLLVSGALTDEFAAFCVQTGADDYVLKDRLRRLPGAIRAVLEKCKLEKERAAYLDKIASYESGMKEAENIAQFGTWKAWIGTENTQWSDGSFRIFGYEPGEAKASFDLFISHVHPEDAELVKSEIGKVMASGLSSEFEYRIITKQGKIKHLLNRTTIQNVSGSGGVLVGFNYDITERKLAESRLLDSYLVAGLGGWDIDMLNEKVTWSDVTRNLFEAEPGYQPDLKQTASIYRVGASRDAVENATEQCILHGTPWDVEVQIVTAKGNVRWVRSIGRAEMRNGKCVRLYGSIQNIDERKRKQLDLEIQNAQLMEIARTQSHEVRAPLASLMGLVDLLSKADTDAAGTKELLAKTVQSANELDAIVRKVVTKTEKLIPLNTEHQYGGRDPRK